MILCIAACVLVMVKNRDSAPNLRLDLETETALMGMQKATNNLIASLNWRNRQIEQWRLVRSELAHRLRVEVAHGGERAGEFVRDIERCYSAIREHEDGCRFCEEKIDLAGYHAHLDSWESLGFDVERFRALRTIKQIRPDRQVESELIEKQIEWWLDGHDINPGRGSSSLDDHPHRPSPHQTLT